MKTMKIALFEGKKIRKIWYKNEWWFSVVDVIAVLTDSSIPKRYWVDLKKKLIYESYTEPYEKIVRLSQGINELSTICRQLKMPAPDGKMRKTDCSNTEGILRIIQSIPSPKAEPFKLWLARIGKERIDEIENPELAVNRAKQIYEKKGYSKNWIEKRMRGIAVRHSLTDEWRDRGIRRKNEYAILTNEIMQGAFDMKVHQYKKFKNLTTQNLRDHMTDLEIILTMFGEAATTEITKVKDSHEFEKLDKDAKNGGKVAGRARRDLEEQTGKRVCSKENYLKEPEAKKRLKKPKNNTNAIL